MTKEHISARVPFWLKNEIIKNARRNEKSVSDFCCELLKKGLYNVPLLQESNAKSFVKANQDLIDKHAGEIFEFTEDDYEDLATHCTQILELLEKEQPEFYKKHYSFIEGFWE